MTSRAGDYAKGFAIALLIEFVALLSLLPGFSATGMRHSPNAPKDDIVVMSEWTGYILHLPTILLTSPFTNSRLPIIFLTPIGQIIFFTLLIGYSFRRTREAS